MENILCNNNNLQNSRGNGLSPHHTKEHVRSPLNPLGLED